MTGPAKRPSQWPVSEPVDLDAIAGPPAVETPDEDQLYMQRAAERALHEMVLSSIQHDLRQQPTPLSVLTSARNWCTRITAAAEDIAQEKRKAA